MINILNRFCDSLTQLGSDLTILEEDGRLSATLLVSNARGVVGHNLCDHLASEEDCELLRSALAQSRLDPNNIASVPLRMKDCHGQQFQIHAYCSCFEKGPQDIRYLLGVVEASERLAGATEGGDLFASLPILPLTPSCSSVSGSGRGSASSSAGGAGGSEGDALKSEPLSHASDVAVTFNLDDELTIVGCSQGFSKLSGPSVGESGLRKWMGKRFLDWVDALGSQLRAHPSPPPFPLTPAKDAAMSYVVGECRLAQATCNEDGTLTLQVKLSQIHGVDRKEWKKMMKESKRASRKRSNSASESL